MLEARKAAGTAYRDLGTVRIETAEGDDEPVRSTLMRRLFGL
jgi:hypothetical protein